MLASRQPGAGQELQLQLAGQRTLGPRQASPYVPPAHSLGADECVGLCGGPLEVDLAHVSGHSIGWQLGCIGQANHHRFGHRLIGCGLVLVGGRDLQAGVLAGLRSAGAHNKE